MIKHMALIDLTHKFIDGMPVYPGDPTPEFALVNTMSEHGCIGWEIKTGMHVGTHIDAPLHMIEGGKKITDFPVGKFFGRGVLIDAFGKKIDSALLKEGAIGKGDIVLIYTGHDKKFRDADYYTSFPPISEEFARELVKRGVSIIGLDSPTPDAPPFAVHKIFLEAEVLIIENLTGLEQLVGVKDFEVIALPAPFAIEAAPAKVVAKIL